MCQSTLRPSGCNLAPSQGTPLDLTHNFNLSRHGFTEPCTQHTMPSFLLGSHVVFAFCCSLDLGSQFGFGVRFPGFVLQSVAPFPLVVPSLAQQSLQEVRGSFFLGGSLGSVLCFCSLGAKSVLSLSFSPSRWQWSKKPTEVKTYRSPYACWRSCAHKGSCKLFLVCC